MDTLLCVDENLFGTIRFLEYAGYRVLRSGRGLKDKDIHLHLQAHAQHPPGGIEQKVAFFTRDKDFLKYLDRSYYLYLITLPPTATQMEQARLIELALEKDFPGRDNPQFEVTIRHVFRQMDGNHVVEIESAMPPTAPHEHEATQYQDALGAWWSYSHINDGLAKAGTGAPVAIFKCNDCQAVSPLGVITLITADMAGQAVMFHPSGHHRSCPHTRA